MGNCALDLLFLGMPWTWFITNNFFPLTLYAILTIACVWTFLILKWWAYNILLSWLRVLVIMKLTADSSFSAELALTILFMFASVLKNLLDAPIMHPPPLRGHHPAQIGHQGHLSVAHSKFLKIVVNNHAIEYSVNINRNYIYSLLIQAIMGAAQKKHHKWHKSNTMAVEIKENEDKGSRIWLRAGLLNLSPQDEYWNSMVPLDSLARNY